MSYVDTDGETKTTDADIIFSDIQTLESKWYIVNSNVTIDGSLTCSGNVKLILADGSSLTVNGGIIVNSGNSFTVYGQSGQSGVLRSEPTDIEDRSGIGGEPGGDINKNKSGNITINGGIVIASGGTNGAGIGGNLFCHGGNITINGGTITAKGGFGGAGIGGGFSGNGGNIVINGGSVKATSGGNGAHDIGGGYQQVAVTPTNGTENVYRIEIDNEQNQNITIDEVPFKPTQHFNGSSTENKVYAYVTGKDHQVIINGAVKYNYTWNSQNSTFTKTTSYLVTLHKNDGTEDTITQWVAENATIANPFERTGYAVLGWYDNENLSGEPVTTFNAANNNRDFWAKWKYDGKALSISSANELITFVKEYNSGVFTKPSELVVTQTADIDLNGIAWTPFNTFSGTYNGNGHAIRNMKKGNGGDKLALPFALTNSGTIRNLTFDGASVFRHATGGSAVVAVYNNGTIENVIVKNSTVQLGNYDNLAGIAATGNGTIKNCAVINTYLRRRYNSTKSAAAIIEANSGTVTNCFAYGCTFIASTINGMVTSGNAPINSYYYMTATSANEQGTAVTIDQFASGEIAHALGSAWGQNLGTDAYPVPGSTNKVYQVTFMDGETTLGTAYTNGAVTYGGEAPTREDYTLTGWTANSDGTGDAVTTVSADMTLYPRWIITNGIGAELMGYSLSLDGNIGVNFYMDLDSSVIDSETAYMQFTVDGKDTGKVYVKDIKNNSNKKRVINGVTYYLFTVEVFSNQMESTITAQMHTGGADDQTGKEYSYSVNKYITSMLNRTDDEAVNAQELIKAMRIYGSNSQVFFDSKSAISNLDEAQATALNEVTADSIGADYKRTVSGTAPEGLTYAGSSLILESQTTIRHYFTVEEGRSFSDYSFDCADVTLRTGTKNGMWYVEIPNIASNKLGTMYILTCGDLSIRYSAYSYAYSTLKTSDDENLKSLVKSLYNYGEKAKAYFND